MLLLWLNVLEAFPHKAPFCFSAWCLKHCSLFDCCSGCLCCLEIKRNQDVLSYGFVDINTPEGPGTHRGEGWLEADLKGEYTQVPVRAVTEGLESAVSTMPLQQNASVGCYTQHWLFLGLLCDLYPRKKETGGTVFIVLTGTPGCGVSTLGPWSTPSSCPDFSNCEMNIGWLLVSAWKGYSEDEYAGVWKASGRSTVNTKTQFLQEWQPLGLSICWWYSLASKKWTTSLGYK